MIARLYSNENFPLPVVEELRRLGHDVLTCFMKNLYELWSETKYLGEEITKRLREEVGAKLGKKDDLFDAQIALVLGMLFVVQRTNAKQQSTVRIFGDEHFGTMLLPECDQFKDNPVKIA